MTLWETTLDRRLFLDDSDVQTVRRVREAQVPDPTTLDEGLSAGAGRDSHARAGAGAGGPVADGRGAP